MGSRLDELQWPRRTARLAIRRVDEADIEAAWAYRRLDDVNRWITAAPKDLDEFRAHFAEPDRLAKTLMFEADGQVIGDLMLAVQDAWAQSEVAEQGKGVEAELGWSLHPNHAGVGYATEAVEELLRICFEDLGIRRVVANCFADNTSSWRLMERIGMRREAYTVKESLHRSGEWLDGMSYAMLADEWRARRD
ncbi:MAG TPA: GNAT family protein [Nocardioidaceae bacterium]|nr:GNAT family protein [Nocardioidaceae bacterium]